MAGSRLDTSSVGVKTFAVTATDTAGTVVRMERRYTVVYAGEGSCGIGPGHAILFPIKVDGSSRFARTLPIPVRFRVCDANGRPLSTPGVVTDFRLVQSVRDGVVVASDRPVPSAWRPAGFRWDPLLKAWTFLSDPKQLAHGAMHEFRITLNDGSRIDGTFFVRWRFWGHGIRRR